MKIFTTLTKTLLIVGLLFTSTSCFVLLEKDSGKKKGWYKNTNNPHHPNTTNPGKSKGKGKGKGKGKH